MLKILLIIYVLIAVAWTVGMFMQWRLMGTKGDFHRVAHSLDDGKMSDDKFIKLVIFVCIVSGLLWPLAAYHRSKDIIRGGW